MEAMHLPVLLSSSCCLAGTILTCACSLGADLILMISSSTTSFAPLFALRSQGPFDSHEEHGCEHRFGPNPMTVLTERCVRFRLEIFQLGFFVSSGSPPLFLFACISLVV